MKRVLVAGSTGYLGGFVCRELKARGHFVRALARSPDKLEDLRECLDEIVAAEVTRPLTLEHVCVDLLEGERQEIDVGGPKILTYREIAELAFQSLGQPARITAIPVWAMRLAIAVTKIFSRHRGELLAFFTAATTSDVVAPAMGIHRLEDHFESLVSAGDSRRAESGCAKTREGA